MKHFYQEIPGYFTWPQFYRDLVQALPRFARGVELGTCGGTSLAFLAVELINMAEQTGRPDTLGVVDGVDTSNSNGVAAAALARVMGPGMPIRHLRAECSWEAARHYGDQSLDFVFIDADHSYESVSKDIAAWRSKVKPGGLIAGHDYSQDFPGVMLAVAEAFYSWQVFRGEKFPAAAELTPEGKQYFPVWSVRL